MNWLKGARLRQVAGILTPRRKTFPESHLPEKHFAERSFSRINICEKSNLPE